MLQKLLQLKMFLKSNVGGPKLNLFMQEVIIEDLPIALYVRLLMFWIFPLTTIEAEFRSTKCDKVVYYC